MPARRITALSENVCNVPALIYSDCDLNGLIPLRLTLGLLCFGLVKTQQVPLYVSARRSLYGLLLSKTRRNCPKRESSNSEIYSLVSVINYMGFPQLYVAPYGM